MGSLYSFNLGFKYLLCMIDFFAKYVRIKPLADKKAKTVFDSFIGIINESQRKPNKLWVDKEWELYNNLMLRWLDSNAGLIYSTYDEDKSVVVERFIRTLKS